ncbi:MAG: muramoyltetrapeptide carboxypeptidase [Verrucomicrobiales bacterium]|jgi:muramoyltetrapeptide carboxypeptidase|nr:muramoyltetrapeptide carboxypeptidase [Verrucomicrobiales bacterium]
MPAYTIELIAPSGYPADAARVARGVARLTAAGHVIVGGERARRRCQRFGGTDAERLADLNALGVADHAPADLVLAVRGGYGLTRLLADVDYGNIARRLRARGTRLVGHSDFTALQLALLAKTGLVTFSGPLLHADFGAEPLSRFTWDNCWRLLAAAESTCSWPSPSAPRLTVSGTLWGGNLTMLCSLLGTPFFPAIDGGILFVEEVNEAPYRVERMLYQLHLAGVLGRQRALLLGSFTGCRSTPADGGYDLAAALAQIATVSGVPMIGGLPYGHVADKLTLPVGAPAELVSRDGQAGLRMALLTD